MFTKMRDVHADSRTFAHYAKRSMRILAEDSLAEFPSEIVDIQTPCGMYKGVQSIAPENIVATSIIRSGDALLEAVREVEPSVRVGKILIQRDESHPDKIPRLFYSKMPPGIEHMYVLLCDPRETFDTTRPLTYAGVVAIAFVVTAVLLAIYDLMVNRRQIKVMKAASRTQAIVTSLFPKDIGRKLVEEAYNDGKNAQSDVWKKQGGASLQTILGHNGQLNGDGTVSSKKPLAAGQTPHSQSMGLPSPWPGSLYS